MLDKATKDLIADARAAMAAPIPTAGFTGSIEVVTDVVLGKLNDLYVSKKTMTFKDGVLAGIGEATGASLKVPAVAG